MNPADFDRILDECLDAVLAGERTIAECLTLYPDQANELKSALQIGLLAGRLKKPEMNTGAVDALEMRLRGQILTQKRPAARSRVVIPFSKLAAMVAIVFLLTVGAGGGAIAASASSLPGDPLYGLKRLWEAIILALSALFNNTDDIWLHLAQTRLNEAEDLAEHGLLYRDVLVDLYDSTQQAMTLADVQTAPLVVVFLYDAEQRLENLPTTAATEPVRADLLLLVMPGPDGRPRIPVLNRQNAETTPEVQPVTTTPTVTLTYTPTITSTATQTASSTPMNHPAATNTPSSTPTSRVPATATRTPTFTPSPTPTITPSITPTATWTALPLPALPTRDPDQPDNDEDGENRPDPTTVPPTSEATVRFRETQAAVYATQTAQAAAETEEASP